MSALRQGIQKERDLLVSQLHIGAEAIVIRLTTVPSLSSMRFGRDDLVDAVYALPVVACDLSGFATVPG